MPWSYICKVTLISVLVFVNIATARAQPDDEPVAIVSRYLDAYIYQDGERAAAVLCAPDAAELDPDAFGLTLDTVHTLAFTADMDLLVYDTLESGDSWALIAITGEVTLAFEGMESTLTLTPHDLGLDIVWAVLEDDTWKTCMWPSEDALQAASPGAIVRLFLGAAYGGNVEGARALICEAHTGAITGPQYELFFRQVADQGLTLDLSAMTIETLESSADETIVELGGTVGVGTDQHPRPVTIPTDRLGFGPVRLVQESGWKICGLAS